MDVAKQVVVMLVFGLPPYITGDVKTLKSWMIAFQELNSLQFLLPTWNYMAITINLRSILCLQFYMRGAFFGCWIPFIAQHQCNNTKFKLYQSIEK
ncbi:hypothetical protein THRCLA_20370 [Thraustotheca clavata]|uniref:Uncharacterized protein n=1 Tax=Thraustotheca clavata TaxID=74557 RepID=A0A1W0A840_9STRA|nr:hypothetical protein THRCLA_20370 [Thraustotheca clavata]